jgi:hypothetical protein
LSSIDATIDASLLGVELKGLPILGGEEFLLFEIVLASMREPLLE